MPAIRDSLRRISSTSVRPRTKPPPHHYSPPASRSHSQSSQSQTDQPIKTRNHSRSFKMSKPSPYLNNSADPVERTSSPYPDPRELGPKSKILTTRTGNYHSTSLRNMVTINTVNKTALHPGGVQYVESICRRCHCRLPPCYTRQRTYPSIGLSRSTQSWRRSFTRRHTSTMTE